uniref:TatD family hydrolase n=1 Tax=Sandarakinorhabdus sp. TaxID=1916663 RepID=UPI00286E9A71
DAEADTLALLREPGEGELRGVIHCFTASQDFAEQALGLGFYISLSGIVTFKNARDLQASALTIPADRLLVETDAPFLAPVPMRGKTCEPAFVAHTARFVAALRGEGEAQLAASTTANFFRLFAKAQAAA